MLDYNKLTAEQRAILNTKGNILVNASAGSGKTTMMIEKVMTLLINDADIRRILIMTFTNDAAAEMKSRLVENIYNELQKNSAQGTKLKKQLDYLPFSNICTMDSFWKTLLRKYFAVIGKDPSSKILEPNEGNLMLNQSIMKVFQRHMERNDEEFFKLAEALNTKRSLEKFAQNIITVRTFMTAQIDEEEYINNARKSAKNGDFSPVTQYALEYYRKRIKIAKVEMEKYAGLLEISGLVDFANECKNFINSAETLINAADFTQLCKLYGFIEVPGKLGRKGSKLDFTKEYTDLIESLRNLFKSIDIIASAYKNMPSGGYVESNKLLELLTETEVEYTRQKELNNSLDFNDLSKYAVKILSDKKTAEEVKNSFDYIFVDEYQDTNYRQEFLLQAISKDDNVFVVGDVKQAIYRFRNAEPDIFISRKDIYESNKTGSNIPLNVNYRSHKEILEFVDKVCGELMTPNFGGVDYKNTSKFRAGAEYEKVEDMPTVSITVLSDDDKKEKECKGVYTVKTGEIKEESEPDFEYAASKITEIVNNKKIYNAKTKQTKLIEYQDIAILVRKWKQGYKMAEILEKYNIPFNVLNNEKKDLQEREYLVDFLRIIHNPKKDIPLANVLFGQIYRFTAKELLDIRKNADNVTLWESINNYKGNPNTVEKINKFLTFHAELRYKSSYYTVSKLLEEILQSGYDAVLLSREKNIIGEINAFMDFIKKSEINNSLEDFLEFYDQSYSGNISPKISNAITITTIFKSKGLEYPVVFLPCLNESMLSNRDDNIIFTDREFGVAVKSIYPESYSIRDNFAVIAHKMKKKEQEREEMLRVLYVALTRAKNHLFLSGKEGKTVFFPEEASSIMDWLEYAKNRDPSLITYFNYQQQNKPMGKIVKDIVKKDISLEKLEDKYPFENSLKIHAKMSVSALTKEENYEGEVYSYTQDKGETDTDIGIAYHTVLQHLSYREESVEDIINLINKLVEEKEIVPENANKVNPNFIFGLLKWEVIANNKHLEFYSEQPFIMYFNLNKDSVDKTLVQGVIDLFIANEETKEAILIDFKVSNASEEKLKEKYSRQLELYGLALEKIGGYRVKEKYVYSVLRGKAVII